MLWMYRERQVLAKAAISDGKVGEFLDSLEQRTRSTPSEVQRLRRKPRDERSDAHRGRLSIQRASCALKPKNLQDQVSHHCARPRRRTSPLLAPDPRLAALPFSTSRTSAADESVIMSNGNVVKNYQLLHQFGW